MFRLNRSAFNWLLSVIKPYIEAKGTADKVYLHRNNEIGTKPNWLEICVGWQADLI
jgi:hypothetical protein